MARLDGSVIEREDADDTTGTPKRTASRRTGGGGSLERVTVNLTARASRALQQASSLTGDTKTDSINRAIQIYAFLEEVLSNGGAIYVKESDSAEMERVKLF